MFQLPISSLLLGRVGSLLLLFFILRRRLSGGCGNTKLIKGHHNLCLFSCTRRVSTFSTQPNSVLRDSAPAGVSFGSRIVPTLGIPPPGRGRESFIFSFYPPADGETFSLLKVTTLRRVLGLAVCQFNSTAFFRNPAVFLACPSVPMIGDSAASCPTTYC